MVRQLRAVLVGAILLSWPAIYNLYPLMYPDSMSYSERRAKLREPCFCADFLPFTVTVHSSMGLASPLFTGTERPGL